MKNIKALKLQRLHTQTVINVFYRTNPDSCLLFSCLIFDFRQGWQINLIYEILQFIIFDNINMIENFKIISFCIKKSSKNEDFYFLLLLCIINSVIFACPKGFKLHISSFCGNTNASVIIRKNKTFFSINIT